MGVTRILDEVLTGGTRALGAVLPGRLGEWFDDAVAVLGERPVENLRRLWPYLRHGLRYRRFQEGMLEYRWVTALLLARRLGVLEVLDRQSGSAEMVAGRCSAAPEAVETLLTVLASRDLVELDDGVWALTPFARTFLVSGGPASEAPLLDLQAEYADRFDEIVDGMRIGETPADFDIATDGPATDPFLDGVNSYLRQAAPELLYRAELPEIRHFIVGSMGVSFSAVVLETHPEASVTYGCLDHLTERIPRLREQYDVDPSRVVETHAHSGDPAEDDWGRESFDLVFLTKKMMLDPQEGVGEAFARKALEVLEPGGAVIFWEAFHEEPGRTDPVLALESVFDLGVSPTAPKLGRETFRKRLRTMGFASVDYVDCLGGATSFAVARTARRGRFRQ